MPIWLRNFTYKSIESHFIKLNEQQNPVEQNNKKLLGPNIQPSFTSKASKK